MQRVAAERETIWDEQLEALLYEEALPLVVAVPETVDDVEVRARAAHFIGRCATEKLVEVEYGSTEIRSLYQAVQQAAEGDPTARKLVESNVATDVIERTIKSGHIMEVALSVDAAGNIQQFGQSMESVQANSLRLAANSWQMRERTEAEAINSFRIQEYFRRGVLKDYSFVVLSRAADNMSPADMQQAGFFTETMSCAIQVTRAASGGLTTESAFVAGVSRAGAGRHDAETVGRLGTRFGVNLGGKTAAETINTPLLVHNSLLPNGVIDLVALYDDCAGGTFFGEDRPPENYLAYRERCRERETRLHPKVHHITEELIADAPVLQDSLAACRRLAELSEWHMVQQAIFDPSVDARVFGAEAAHHIEQARLFAALGDNQALEREHLSAQRTAQSHSCPGGAGKGNAAEEGSAQDQTSNVDEDKYGSLTFKCKNGHTNHRPRGKLISSCWVPGCKNSVAC